MPNQNQIETVENETHSAFRALTFNFMILNFSYTHRIVSRGTRKKMYSKSLDTHTYTQNACILKLGSQNRPKSTNKMDGGGLYSAKKKSAFYLAIR